jgi:hypothetical protein
MEKVVAQLNFPNPLKIEMGFYAEAEEDENVFLEKTKLRNAK